MVRGRDRQAPGSHPVDRAPFDPGQPAQPGSPSGSLWSPWLAGWKPSQGVPGRTSGWHGVEKSGGLAATGHRMVGTPPVLPGSPLASQRGGLMLLLCGDMIPSDAPGPAAAIRAH